MDLTRPDCRRVLGRGGAGGSAALLGGRRGRLDLPRGRTCVGVAASRVVRDRPRPPEGPASAGESENHERRGVGPVAADDPLAGRPGCRRAASDPPRGPGPRMGPRAQPRPVALGPGPMSAGGALRPSVVLVVAAGGAQRPGVSGRRRSGWRRSARLRPRVAPLGPSGPRGVAGPCLGGRGNLGECLTAFEENCHAIGREP